jgi:hypothetical protein
MNFTNKWWFECYQDSLEDSESNNAKEGTQSELDEPLQQWSKLEELWNSLGLD